MTDVWRRRVVAALVDLAVVLVVLAGLVLAQVERFTQDAMGLFSPEDFDRLTTLAAMPNRAVEIGDTTYVLAGGRLLMTVVVTLLTIAAIHVVMPGGTGTSPGKWLTRLRVITIHGDLVDYGQSLKRTLVGVVDLLPVVVPWALGAAVALRSPHRQRLGDRVAGTVVVDARLPVTFSVPSPAPVTAQQPARGATGPDDRARAVRSGSGPAGSAPGRTDEAPAPGPAATAGRRALPPPPCHRQTPAPAAPSALPAGSPSPRPGADPADRPAGPSPQPISAELRVPGRVPPPQHRRPTADGSPAADTGPAADGSPAADTAGWEHPRAEPAPVWHPPGAGPPDAGPADAGPPGAGDPPAEGPGPAEPGVAAVLEAATDALTAGLLHPPSRAPSDDEAPADEAPLPDEAPAGGAAAPGEPHAARPPTGADLDEPVWNEQWQAWLFYDRDEGRWHRHDPISGEWVPIS
jgi:uncharacterized RDD family membrane protein YckC